MRSVSLAVPLSAFLARRMGGLSGVSRSVILADLAGATTIYLVADPAETAIPQQSGHPPGRAGPCPDPVSGPCADPRAWPEDWAQSFAVRGLSRPHVVRMAPGDSPPAGTVFLPGDRLLTQSGIARMIRGGADPATGEGFQPGDVTPARTAREATTALLRATLKPDEGWVGRHLNRPISFAMARLMMRTDLSPNIITWATFVLALVTAVVLAHGGAVWMAVGGGLYQVISVVDCVDGDLARVTHRTSKSGAALDTAFDMIANLGTILGLTAGLARTYGFDELGWSVALFGAMICGIVAMATLVRFGPRGGSFDLLRQALTVRLAHRPRLQRVVLTVEKGFKRDFYALAGSAMTVAGFGWLLPRILLFAAFVWLAAIAWCAPLILRDKDGALLPRHLRHP